MSVDHAAQSAPNIRHAREWLLGTAAKLHEWAGLEPDARKAAAMRDEASTVTDVADRAPLPLEGGAVVVMTHSAIEAYGEAVNLLLKAQRWAQGADLDITEPDVQAKAEKRRVQVVEMELTLHRSLSHLMLVAQDYDGPVKVTRDGEGCFFWSHSSSGYHGGIIFHANYAEKGTKRLPVGTWSIHT